jgi:hypothetical protein
VLVACALLVTAAALTAPLPMSLAAAVSSSLGSSALPSGVNPFLQQGAKLTGSGEIDAGAFGMSVALSGDGETALVGGPDEAHFNGAAWVFSHGASGWTEQAELTPSDETGRGEFGTSVALSSDGNIALIGAPGDNSNNGAVWVFVRSGSTWTQRGAKLTPTDESGASRFGYSVSLAGNGATALVSAPQDSVFKGAVWVFAAVPAVQTVKTKLLRARPPILPIPTAWQQQGSKLTPNDETGDSQFGFAVSLSSDGSSALIGSNSGLNGAAWVFTKNGSAWTQTGGQADREQRGREQLRRLQRRSLGRRRCRPHRR